MPVSANDILYAGLSQMGWDDEKITASLDKAKLNKWKGAFVPSAGVCASVFNTLVLHNHRVDLVNFLMTIFWLSNYPVMSFICQLWKVTEKTCSVHIKKHLEAMSALKELKIRWILNNINMANANFLMTVDGTHCRIEEPRTQPSTEWYSHKFNGPGLAYEIGLSIFYNQIMWVNGPFRAGTSDLQIYRQPGGLKERIPQGKNFILLSFYLFCLRTSVSQGKRLIADKGYNGEPETLSTPNDFDSVKLKTFKKRARAHQETLNGRLKRFKVLENCFRHGTEDNMIFHKRVFYSCLIICQFEIETEAPLFEV